jgi:hypothetical protein
VRDDRVNVVGRVDEVRDGGGLGAACLPEET